MVTVPKITVQANIDGLEEVTLMNWVPTRKMAGMESFMNTVLKRIMSGTYPVALMQSILLSDDLI